jgi:hypothetical protein
MDNFIRELHFDFATNQQNCMYYLNSAIRELIKINYCFVIIYFTQNAEEKQAI